MNLSATLLVYLTIGLGMDVALLAGQWQLGAGRHAFLMLTALLFWPLYVPLLLTAPQKTVPPDAPARAAADDDMAVAIAQVECELAAAFASLDGWAENVLDGQHDQLLELGAALRIQAARIREMDKLSERTRSAGDELPLDEGAVAEQGEAFERFRHSRRARGENLERLAEVRRAAYADLMATLAWIGELVSMMQLAKFTGAPAARAEELVAQIAAAVEGISAATWHEESALQ